MAGERKDFKLARVQIIFARGEAMDVNIIFLLGMNKPPFLVLVQVMVLPRSAR
jgi:hypothetical protein